MLRPPCLVNYSTISLLLACIWGLEQNSLPAPMPAGPNPTVRRRAATTVKVIQKAMMGAKTSSHRSECTDSGYMGEMERPTGLLKPYDKMMEVTGDPCPNLSEQRAIVDEVIDSIKDTAGIGVVKFCQDELRDNHRG